MSSQDQSQPISSTQDSVRRPTWIERINRQGGPWDQTRTALMLQGPPSLPMPVRVAEPASLAPYFSHLKSNGTHVVKDLSASSTGTEPYYDVPFAEFEKGVVYADRRLDLCKMVVGPLNIAPLMDSLEENTFVEHFLLGNNIIGPVGGRRIAEFINDHPARMDTWYLAGNCIDMPTLKTMVDSLVGSDCTNLWLKRNPLGPNAGPELARYILNSKLLRTLDLDQTGLDDEGVTKLFDLLCSSDADSTLPLRHLYLNATGIGLAACSSISRFLQSPRCGLESLYLGANPIGDDGAALLASGLSCNSTLRRLMLPSTGLTSVGATSLLTSVAGHASLTSLNIGQNYATEDLGARFNWLTDSCVPAALDLIATSPRLRYLDLGHTAISHPAINRVLAAAADAPALCWLHVASVLPATGDSEVVRARLELRKWKPRVRARLEENVQRLYDGMGYEEFCADEKRWLTGPKEDLRKIDSVYRNRDAGMARRGLKVLDKFWEDGDETLSEVMAV